MREYVNELKEVLDGLNLGAIQEAIEIIESQIKHNKVILTCGNGGSAATASHLVCDLGKNIAPTALAICLNDNMGLSTAYANDIAYSEMFCERVAKWANRSQGGVFVGISTSGKSRNIWHAAQIAKQWDMQVIALTGGNGGELGFISAVEIRVPSDKIQIIEDVHLSICHMIAVGLGA